MSAWLGDFLLVQGGDVDVDGITHRLAMADAWPPWCESRDTVYLNPAPGTHLWYRGSVVVSLGGSAGGLGLCLQPLSDAGHSERAALDTIRRWVDGRSADPSPLRGRFAFVLWDAATQQVVALTDRFRTCSLLQAPVGLGGVAITTDLRLLTGTGLVERRIHLPALYHYLNFSYVPAPVCAVENVEKIGPGQRLHWRAGRVEAARWWQPRYPGDLDGSDEDKAKSLRKSMVDVVSRYGRPDPQGWGTFLSGGTDSTSIASILRSTRPQGVKTFSIGFAEQGYDELGYSRLATETLGLTGHEVRVSEADAVALVPKLAHAFDEPFGNSSAIPTFYGANLACAHGVHTLVAGDGGDEIFGGNERYRKDAIFGLYRSAPSPVQWLGDAGARLLAPLDLRFTNRVRNFVERSAMPQPDRFYSDDSFASRHYDELLTAAFRNRVQRDESLDVQRRVYADAPADDELHRVMYLDLAMTIADNDAVKVVRACKLAGVQVAFPYLDPELIEFTGRLPARDKVRGLNKRHLFKLATADILPEAIRKKKKQGFALPVSVWLARKGAFRDLAHDIVFSRRAVERGYFETAYVKTLFKHHERGAWDHGQELYSLLMLELWHRQTIDHHG
jgi:asparagine synthase (glutamine-hydrolysing)